MADILEDFRVASRRIAGYWPDEPLIATINKGESEIGKLRDEVKKLRKKNAELIASNILLGFALSGSACVVFMALFLSR